MTTQLFNELQLQEAELHHPGLPCTRGRLELLLHVDFHEVGRSGRPYSREFVIEHLLTRKSPPKVQAEGYKVFELAADCALLTYRSAYVSAIGALVDPALRSSIWRRTEGVWQLFYHQGTPTDLNES